MFKPEKVRAAGECIRQGLLTPREAIRRLLFQIQRQLYDSVLDNRQSAALAGRRSGKTSTIIALIALCCGFLGWKVVLVYPDARQARAKVIGKLTRFCRLLGVVVNTRMSDGVVEIGLGELEIGSAHTRAAIDSIRGDGSHLCIIDEPASIEDEDLEYLMDEVVGPSLMDHGGHWLMTGTPSDVALGRWWSVTDGPVSDNLDAVWHVIRDWDYLQNPELKDPERTIDAELARMGVTRESDKFLREYKAQYVASDLVKPLHWTIANDFNELPRLTPVMRVVGIDIGFTDEDALGALYVYRGGVYLVEEDIEAGQTDDDLAEKTRGMGRRHQPHITTADSANAKTIATLQAKGLPVVGAKKGRGSVPEGLKQLDSLLREVRFFARKDSRFVKDAANIRWKEPGKTLRKSPHSNIIPAVRYALDVIPPEYLLPAPPSNGPPSIFENPVLKGLMVNPNEDKPNYT
jgi:hypothetical protein